MTRTNAILIVLAGGVFMSFAGLSLRFVEEASAVQVLIYRSFALGCAIPFIACWRRRVGPAEFFGSIGREDVVMGVLMAGAFSFYIYSILNTSVASTLFILSAAPFIAAVVGWIWIGERPKRSTWISMVVALVGVTIMVADGLGTGRLAGNLFALVSAACFATSLVWVRKTGRDDMLGGTFLGGMFASGANLVLALALGQALLISDNDLAASLISGALTIGIGMALVIWGASCVPAAEVSILVLIESVLGPFWVWLFLNEKVSTPVLFGGLVILISVALQAWFSRPRRQQSRAFRFGPAGAEARQEQE